MAQITVDDTEIKENLSKYVDETLGAAANEGVNLACQVILASAIRNCPVDSGQLQNSLTMDVNDETHTGSVGTNVEYAPYVEIGTTGHKPQPFLQPAVEQNKDKIKEVIRNAIANAK